MRLSRDHRDALEAHVDTIMRTSNRWLFVCLALYGAALAYLCWRLA